MSAYVLSGHCHIISKIVLVMGQNMPPNPGARSGITTRGTGISREIGDSTLFRASQGLARISPGPSSLTSLLGGPLPKHQPVHTRDGRFYMSTQLSHGAQRFDQTF